MPILAPDHWFRHITDIPAAFFVEKGIRLVALDVDNTLTTHDNPVPAEGVQNWLEEMQKAGLTLVILSNNSGPRVEPFAGKLGLPHEAKAAKPLPFGLIRACRGQGVSLKECAIIGDQLFTDILCGNYQQAPAGGQQVSRLQQTAQIMNGSIRIAAADGLLEGRQDVIMGIAVPVIAHGAALGNLHSIF